MLIEVFPNSNSELIYLFNCSIKPTKKVYDKKKCMIDMKIITDMICVTNMMYTTDLKNITDIIFMINLTYMTHIIPVILLEFQGRHMRVYTVYVN